MKITEILITPFIAKGYLEANKMNRRVNPTRVTQYYNDMIQGKWQSGTAEAIKISNKGNLLDGQHRLLALIKANTSVYFYVATGLEETTFDVLDSGAGRNNVDVFSIAKIKNSNSIPSIMAFYETLTSGYRSNNYKAASKSTATVLLDRYYAREEFWQHTVYFAHKNYLDFAKILPQSTVGGFYAFLFDINEKDAKSFIIQLCTGNDISNNSIALLRSMLMKDKMSSRKMKASNKYALIIKTWNHFRTGQKMKSLSFNPEVEKYPIAK